MLIALSTFGSCMTVDTRCSTDIRRCIATASHVFSSLLPTLLDKNITFQYRRFLYRVSVLSVLLYGAECWTPLRGNFQRIDTFHHNCIRLLLGVTRSQQWEADMSSVELRRMWGEEISISAIVQQRRMPLLMLFSRLESQRPACRPRRRWRDVINTNLRAAGVESWLLAARDRKH